MLRSDLLVRSPLPPGTAQHQRLQPPNHLPAPGPAVGFCQISAVPGAAPSCGVAGLRGHSEIRGCR